jgi:hypothetical protein
MKKHVGFTGNKTLALALLASLGLASCKDCNPFTKDPEETEVRPPTVETPAPRVREATLVVRGTRAANNVVWVSLAHQDEAIDLAAAEDSEAWEGQFTLREGENVMTFFASDAQGERFSDVVGPYTVVRDSTPPAVPTVDPYAPGVGLGGQSQVTLTFAGTKGADGNILVDGVEKVARDGTSMRWTYSVDVGAGEYRAVLSSADDLGNQSATVTISVVVGDVPAPTLDAITSPTRTNPIVISGGKAADTSVHLRWAQDGEDVIELSAATAGTTWSKSVRFQEGANSFWVLARKNGAPSALVAGNVIVDTTAPVAPTVDAYPSSVMLNGQTTVTMTFTGTKAEDGNLLINGGEVVTLEPPTSTWSQNLVLGAGRNQFTLVSEDALGNQSAAVTIDVTTSDIVAPTLDSVTSPTAAAAQVIRGGKAAGTSVWLHWVSQTVADVEVAPENSTTRWSGSINLSPGHNDFCVYAKKTGVTGQSGNACGMIAYLPSFTVNQVTSPTKLTVARLTGTKGAGFFVKMYKEGTTDVQTIVPTDNLTVWAHDLTLAEGPNAYLLFAGMPGIEETTAEVPVIIELDTMPPAAPVINPIPDSPTGNASVTLMGTRDGGGNLLLRKNQEANGTQVAARDGASSFSVVTDLVLGNNQLCLSAADALGNTSSETCATVMRVAGPQVTITAPLSGATLRGNSVTVDATVVVGHAAEEQVTEVRACIDGSICRLSSRVGSTEGYTTSLEVTGFENNSAHVVSVTAKNAANVSSSASITVSYTTGLALLSTTGVNEDALQPRLALDGSGDLHVVWMDRCIQRGVAQCPESQAGNMPWDIFHRKKVGVGGWGAIELVSSASGDGDSGEPDIATDSAGNIHVVWVDDGNIAGKGGDRDVMHRIWNTATQSWGAILVVTDTATEEYTPRLAPGGPSAQMHLVWDAQVGASHEIFYNRWDGAAWGTPVQVAAQLNGRTTNPAVAGDSAGCAHVAWQGQDDAAGVTSTQVHYRTVCNGSTLGTSVLVSTNSPAASSRAPSVVVDGTGLVSVVWADSVNAQGSGTDGDIWVSQFRNSVFVAGSLMLVSTDSTLESATPVVAVVPGGSELTIAWAQRTGTGDADNADIWYSVSDGGLFMSSAVATANNSRSLTPALVVDPALTLHLVWEDATTLVSAGDQATADMDIFYLGTPLN